MNPKRYFLISLAATLALVGMVWILAYWIQPLHGDLARIGGFAERDFGANEPMQEFRPLISTFGAYEQPVDVLVIGDSFANVWPYQQWQNWLVQKTGWEIHTLDVHDVDLDILVNSSWYRRAPPRLVIWNVVERDLLDEYGRRGRCVQKIPAVANRPLDIQPTARVPVDSIRPKYFGLNPGFVRVWLSRTFLRELLGINASDALNFRLVREDLFSSWASDEILVYRNDLRKARWKPADLERIRCGFSDLAARVQSNGTTRFITAIAPDKSSAYRAWLAKPGNVPESPLPALLTRFPVTDARLDIVLADAIARGTRDVYMPDDTHWGAAGQKLVADAILNLLIKEGLAQ